MRPIVVGLLCLPAFAGCGGGGPAIDPAVAGKLAGQAEAIAQKASVGDVCAARTHARILQRQTIAAINAGKIPAAYQETLQARVTEIDAALEPRCLPSLSPAPRASEQPSPVQEEQPRGGAEHGKHEKKHKGHGHGRGHD